MEEPEFKRRLRTSSAPEIIYATKNTDFPECFDYLKYENEWNFQLQERGKKESMEKNLFERK